MDFVKDAQPVSTSAICTAFNMSSDMVRRRTRILKGLGMLTIHVRAMHEENRIVLGTRAPLELTRAFDIDPSEVWVPRGIGKVDLAHHEPSVQLHASFLSATLASDTWDLTWHHERAVRRRMNTRGARVPDSVALLRNLKTGITHAIIVEVELTNNPSWVASKAEDYADAKDDGAKVWDCANWTVLYVVPSRRRLNRLVSAIWNAGVPEGIAHFIEIKDIKDPSRILTDAPYTTAAVGEDGDRARLAQRHPLVTSTHLSTRHNRRDGHLTDIVASPQTIRGLAPRNWHL
jgi:hypothetical protein